jgi:type 1 glutamine amidotransferase
MLRTLLALVLAWSVSTPTIAAQDDLAPATAVPWVVYRGEDGPGAGAHIVFVTGDEEYRSEEGMPLLARILAVRLGFTCTVLFAIDPNTGAIDPGVGDNIPGLDALDDADLMVVFTRFRDLPDEQMKHFVDYVESGRPIVGLRTATHAFDIRQHPKYRRYSWRNPDWEGGFGRQVLGETWIAHHGGHGSESSRGIVAPGAGEHPILRGIADGAVWDPSDVYTVRLPLPEGCEPLLLGQVLAGMSSDADPVPPRTREDGEVVDKNDPMMPVAWTRTWSAPNGDSARVFATTLGSAQAFAQEGARRLLVNACLWALGMDTEIEPDLDVSIVGGYEPSPFGFGKHRKHVRPADLAWPRR